MYRQRLAHSVYDSDAWLGLIQEAKHRGDDRLLYEAYSDALVRYPSSGYLLSSYVELELSRGNKEKAESVFNEKLFIAPSLELWQCYLGYVLRSHTDGSGIVSQPESRATVTNCYKLVLDNVGGDREAGQIWIDYIGFLNSGETHGQLDDQLRIAQVREAYQRAVAIPLLKVEEIWKSYDAFENNLNRGAAKRFLSDMSSAYMTARTALREMNKHWDVIKKTGPPQSLPKLPEWSPREIGYLDAWKSYLKWEASNPLRLESAELTQKRVVYAYSQACMVLRFYPEVWIEFADYLWSLGHKDEALAKIQVGSEVLPESLSVQFAYAEMAEKLKQMTVCKQIYERVVSSARAEIDTTTSKYTRRLDKLSQKLKELSDGGSRDQAGVGLSETASQAGESSDLSSDSETDGDDMGDSMSADEDSEMGGPDLGGSAAAFSSTQPALLLTKSGRVQRSVERRIDRTKQRMGDRLDEQREMYTLAWIMYLRFVRRSEGIESARQLLRRPRGDPSGYITHHLFVAAALMEYHVGKRADVAGRLFEYYSKNYADHREYILQYMRFLIDSNDDSNARALFERFHSQSTGDTKEMWDMFADYEYNYGDMSSISKLDKRYIDKFPDESAITRISAKYSYLSIDAVATRDFGFNHRYGDHDVDMPRQHSGGQLGDVAGDYALGDGEGYRARGDAPPGADQLDDIRSVAVGSITGRFLSKRQLMAPVRSSRFVRPSVAGLEAYRPTIEPLPEPAPESSVPGAPGAGPANSASALLHQRLLGSGDVLSYVTLSLAAPSISEFDAQPLDVDTLLDTVMASAVSGPLVPSDYRPLEYMMPLKRQRLHQPSAYEGSYHRRDRAAGREYSSRSRSRGYSGGGDTDGGSRYSSAGHRGHGSHPFKHPRGGHSSRGPYRQTPYARSSGYSGTDGMGRSPYKNSESSQRYADRGGYSTSHSYR
ncbi:Suf-domain-containing protein [Martensiomyces pterosporus]|nr:Suf-domain-containing protein [Martensiomyces pterosporus]